MLDCNCKVQVPSFTFSSNLKSLELRYVTIVDDRYFKWISCCCKCIEDIDLDIVYDIKNVTIESSSLQSFSFAWSSTRTEMCHLHISGKKLREIVIDWPFHQFCSPADKSLNIFAPNPKTIKWAGSVMKHLNLGKLVCLEEAEIRLQPKVDDWDSVFKVLCSLREAKVLTRTIIQASGFDMGYWKLKDLSFFNQLKEITIELWDGSNGIELARYILKHAKNLEKMIVIHLPENSNVEGESSESKMISNAALVF